MACRLNVCQDEGSIEVGQGSRGQENCRHAVEQLGCPGRNVVSEVLNERLKYCRVCGGLDRAGSVQVMINSKRKGLKRETA